MYVRGNRRRRPINQGDFVLHPRHGVGRIQSIARRSFLGEEPARFAKLFFQRDGLTIHMRRQDLDQAVRSIISADEARRLLDHLAACEATMSPRWKTRSLRNEAIIDDGDPFKLAGVYKGLASMQARGETLRAADRRHLQLSLDLLCEELAAALGEARSDVERMIIARCGITDDAD